MIRLAHLGYVDTFDTIVAIPALEMALCKFEFPVDFDKGVGAAQEILLKAIEPKPVLSDNVALRFLNLNSFKILHSYLSTSFI